MFLQVLETRKAPFLRKLTSSYFVKFKTGETFGAYVRILIVVSWNVAAATYNVGSESVSTPRLRSPSQEEMDIRPHKNRVKGVYLSMRNPEDRGDVDGDSICNL